MSETANPKPSLAKDPLLWFANRSIFLKLAVVIFFAALLVNLVVWTLFRAITSNPNARMHHMVQTYTNFVIHELGTPPRLARAQELAAELSMDIYYVGPHGHWGTSPNLPQVLQVRFYHPRMPSGLDWGTDGQIHYFRALHPNGYFYFAPLLSADATRHDLWMLILLMLLSTVFVGVFVMIRRIFNQVYVLQQGVWEVSQGRLDHEVKINNTDELGQLSSAFNHMTRQVRRQLHSKEQLLLNVSHELRSPLTRMRLALEFIEDEKIKERLTQETRAMDKMLAELLESARLESEHGILKRERANLGLLLQEVVQETLPDPSRAQLSLGSSPVFAEVDVARVKTLLKNLLENACKYSDPAQPLELRLQAQGKQVLIAVQDHGEGIPEFDLPHLFEPFYRVDKSRNAKTGGYGLGLALCRRIALAHGGSLDAASQVGVGTTFTLTLPCCLPV